MNGKARAWNEREMRESGVPWLKTQQELSDYIANLVAGEHDYGTCVYAMSMAAVAAFNHVATTLGVTGFQASCADLDILRRTRHVDGPFMLLKAGDALYPQYDLHAKLDEMLTDARPWLTEQAKANLAKDNEHTHPNVIAHWKKLAALAAADGSAT